jgi:hypothetical protein
MGGADIKRCRNQFLVEAITRPENQPMFVKCHRTSVAISRFVLDSIYRHLLCVIAAAIKTQAMRLVRRYRPTLRSQGTFSSGRMQLVLVSAAILECEYQAWLSPSQGLEPPAIPGRVHSRRKGYFCRCYRDRFDHHRAQIRLSKGHPWEIRVRLLRHAENQALVAIEDNSVGWDATGLVRGSGGGSRIFHRPGMQSRHHGRISGWTRMPSQPSFRDPIGKAGPFYVSRL